MSGKNLVLHIESDRQGNINVSGNTTDLMEINWLLDRVKLQMLTVKKKEPSMIERV